MSVTKIHTREELERSEKADLDLRRNRLRRRRLFKDL